MNPPCSHTQHAASRVRYPGRGLVARSLQLMVLGKWDKDSLKTLLTTEKNIQSLFTSYSWGNQPLLYTLPNQLDTADVPGTA